jgi:hypothetical protein
MGGLHFMWISTIGPEKCDSIEERLNVCDPIFPSVGKNSQKATALLHVPVNVQVVYARDASAVSVWIVHMLNIVRALSFVARYHRL